MGKWIYVDNRPRYFKTGEEFASFLKERIDKYNESRASK